MRSVLIARVPSLEKQVSMYKEKVQELQAAIEQSREETRRLQAENRLLKANMA